MRVASKFVAVMVLMLLVIRVVEGMLTVHRETDRLDASVRRDAELLGHMLQVLVRGVWAAQGPEQAMDALADINVDGHPVQFAWVPIEGEDGVVGRVGSEAVARLRGGTPVSYRTFEEPGGEVYRHLVPLDTPEGGIAIEVAQALAERSRYIRNTVIRETVAGTGALLAGGCAAILLGIVVIGRPLSLLRDRVADIGEGRLDVRIRLRGRDELSALADGLNEMCAKLSDSYAREREATEKQIAMLEQMRHADRLATIGRLASGIAHELGTPLNVICGRAGMIARADLAPEHEAVRRNAETIRAQGGRMTEIIGHLLDFARQRPLRRVRADASAVVRQTVDLVSCLGYKGSVRIAAPEDAEDLTGDMDPQQMQQVMTNLLANALQAMPDGGEVTVAVDTGTATPPRGIGGPAGRYLRIAVEDQGCGIAPEHQESVFDPFFTTKETGQGTGLGLSIAYGIVREHGGWIGLESAPGRGSRFTVHIPRGDAA